MVENQSFGPGSTNGDSAIPSREGDGLVFQYVARHLMNLVNGCFSLRVYVVIKRYMEGTRKSFHFIATGVDGYFITALRNTVDRGCLRFQTPYSQESGEGKGHFLRHKKNSKILDKPIRVQ